MLNFFHNLGVGIASVFLLIFVGSSSPTHVGPLPTVSQVGVDATTTVVATSTPTIKSSAQTSESSTGVTQLQAQVTALQAKADAIAAQQQVQTNVQDTPTPPTQTAVRQVPVPVTTQVQGVSSGYTDATTGTVVYTTDSCDYYIIEDNTDSYDLLEWFGGYTPDDDDTLIGGIDHFGFVDLYDSTVEQSTHTYIEDWGLTATQASDELTTNCPDNTSAPFVNTYTNYVPDTTYTNVDGNTVDSPSYENYGDATAECNDGTYSYSQNHSGTCSDHGGVSEWLQ